MSLYKVDYLDDAVLEWHATATGVECIENSTYTPTIYAIPDSDYSFEDLLRLLDDHPLAVSTALERWARGFRHDLEPVLRIDVRDIGGVDELARYFRSLGSPGAIKCFNVDFSREFRYCLETDQVPRPDRDLRSMALEVAPTELVDLPLRELTIDGEPVTGEPSDVADAVTARLEAVDPDVLVCSTSDLVPALYETAKACDLPFELGRRPGWQTLAGASTFESYGQVGHSPARYNVPGRAIVDRSNTFFYGRSGLEGCLDLSRRSSKPLQEVSWASIGNVLTAIQIQEARDRRVLTPWKSWRHEFFKPMRTLHEADRGGFTFAPDVGFHEDVHELDFASLYPNIIVTRNVSPETICCSCHPDRADVPDLGYSLCDDRGYLADVLEPLIDDREAFKTAMRAADDPEEAVALERKSNAIKWILVSCFGYQGFSNAKFGRIECHEAINAFAREILLEAKATLEAGGWRVVHGIVDSLWVQARDGVDQRALGDVAAEISEDVGIRLEYESAFDWVCFVPMRTSDAGALTKYFGKKGDGTYKHRGIECRQRSTPPFVDRAQRALIETLDRHRAPEAVCDRLRAFLREIRSGDVDPRELVVTVRSSKRLEEYTQSTTTVAALERAAAMQLDQHPGQAVDYVVVDDSKSGRERVRLPAEGVDEYDVSFYAEQVLRAAESVVSPLGWRRDDIDAHLADRVDSSLDAW